jgi:putative PEP-CTERM system TPR-repeat lipoprotein
MTARCLTTLSTRTFAPLLLALAATAFVGGCGNDSTAALIGSAKEYLAKDDPKAAVIQLKSALQKDPSSGEARFLLGKALLASGDVQGATLELRKALDLRQPENEVVPELARAMFVAGDYQRVTEQFGLTVLSDPAAEADLKMTLARTWGGLGRRDQARSAVDAAQKAVPDYGPANVFLARLQADTGDIDGALTALQAQIERTPQDAEAWQIKGDLLALGKRDLAGALAAYRHSVQVNPKFVPGHVGALTVLLAQQDLAGAKTQLAELQKVLPNHPQTQFFAASVALLDKDLDKANEITQRLLRAAPDNPRVLQLAGAIAFQQKSWLQAENHLAKALQRAPNLDVARRLLAVTYLQSSAPAKALATLQPLLDRPQPGAAVYALVGQAHLEAGEIEDAEKAFAKAAELDPADTRSRAAVAVGKVMSGHADAGVADLEALAASDTGTTADLPLIGALVRKKDYAGALKAIDSLEKKQPDKPIASNLRARVLLLQGDVDGAKKSFERALQIQPSFFPAAGALAQIALKEKRQDDAKKILADVLKADPRNSEALLANAALKARMGAPREEIVGMFNDAIRQQPADPAPRLALINYQLANNDVTAALESAQQAVSAVPNNPGLLDALGRAQAASGDANQAVASFNKLAQLMPTSPAPYLRIAGVRWAAKNLDGAVEALKRALSIEADNLQAQRALIDAYVAEERTADALAVTKTIQQQRPTADVGYLLEGSIESARRQWDQALSVYRAGLKAVPDSTELSTRVHLALTAQKNVAAADQHAATWLKEHPKDAGFRFYLGDVALARKDYAAAEQYYRQVLELTPNQALAMNNVAWLMVQAKRPGAVAMAEKANDLLPGRAVIMDTLAQALASEGQIARGLDVMKQALKLDPKNATLRLNYAKLLAQSGDKASARTELKSLAELGDKFPRQKEVGELLKTL